VGENRFIADSAARLEDNDRLDGFAAHRVRRCHGGALLDFGNLE
jgi:hypothetical protein